MAGRDPCSACWKKNRSLHDVIFSANRSSEEGNFTVKIGIDEVQSLDDERVDLGVELKMKKDLNNELKNLFDGLSR